MCAEVTKALWWYVCKESLFFKVMPFMTKDSFEYCLLGLKDYYFFVISYKDFTFFEG
jgi:hypothetical protein